MRRFVVVEIKVRCFHARAFVRPLGFCISTLDLVDVQRSTSRMRRIFTPYAEIDSEHLIELL